MTIKEKISKTTRRSFLQSLGGGVLAGPSLLKANSVRVLHHNAGTKPKHRIDIDIPDEKLDMIVWKLNDLADMQMSNYMADYDDEDLEMASLYRDEARSVRTVLDVVRFITSLGQDHLVDHYDTIDYADKFEIKWPEKPGELLPNYAIQEKLFREYLSKTYGIDTVEFPLN